MNRRDYLKNTVTLLGGLAVSTSTLGNFRSFSKTKTILVCSGIQFSNIGDMGHVTGILASLNLYMPDVQIILWPRINVREFDGLISSYWPDVQIVHSRIINEKGEEDYTGKPENKEVYQMMEKIDFVIGGHADKEKVRWIANNFKKPYGFYGVAINKQPDPSSNNKFFDDASFIFTRETTSLEYLVSAGVKCPVMDFSPDANFGSTISDANKAVHFMRQNGLKHKEFICVVPRLRKQPYYKIAPSLQHAPHNWTDHEIEELESYNRKYSDIDHEKVRTAMIDYVRRTGHHVLLCPEMIHYLEYFDELLFNPLPDDVKSKVIKMDHWWLIDEAAMIYKNAVAVISMKAHSPIIALTQGTPAIHIRQPEDGGQKGQMYYDLGLSKWIFEIDETEGRDISDCLMDILNDYPGSLKYLESAMDYVRFLQRKSMLKIRDIIFAS